MNIHQHSSEQPKNTDLNSDKQMSKPIHDIENLAQKHQINIQKQTKQS